MELGKVSIKDDLSYVASKMATSLAALDKKASELFVDSHGNLDEFKKSLKAGGVAAVDVSLIVGKFRKELVATRKEQLGLGDSADKAAKLADKALKIQAKEQEKLTKIQLKEEEKRQKAQDKARINQEKNSTWNKAKAAFSEAVSPRQIAIGAARKVGENIISAPGALLSGAFGIVESIGSKVVEVGKDLVGAIIDAAQFRQNAITGLEYMLGSRKEAERIFADAQKLAQDTPLDTDKVITGIKQLATAGFSGDESLLLFKAVADQASKFQDDPAIQEKVISAFSRVKGRGVANGEDLESFRVAGFRAENIVEQLRGKENLAPLFKSIKKTDSQEDIIKKVKKVLGEGKIGSTTFLNAALASLEKDKPDLGEFAKKMGKISLTGTISNFKSAFGDLLKSTNIDSWKGIQAFQGFLTRITEALQGDVGKGLLKTIQNIIDSLLGGLDNIKAADIEGFVGRVARLGEAAVDVIKDAWSWLDRLLHGADIGDDLGDILLDVAKYIGAGIWEGVKNASSIINDRNSQRDAKFLSKHGVSVEDAAAGASRFGVDKKTFISTFDAAKAAFYKSGGVVDFSASAPQRRDESRNDYLTRYKSSSQLILDAVLAYNAKQTDLARANENFDTGADSPYRRLYAVGLDAAAGFEKGARTELDSHSPSRTMARVGEDAARGLVLGVQGGTDKGAADLRRRGDGAMFQMGDIVIQGATGDADAVATAVQQTLEREMLAFWERRALES